MSSTHVMPRNRTVKIERTMHIIECASCSIDFGIGDDFMTKRRKDHGEFYCPNGHVNYYSGDNTEEKLRKDLERAHKREVEAFEYAERERERALAARRQTAAFKGQVTKIRNRVKNGVCPECNRSFANVKRHMDSQHPECVS